MFDGLEYQGRTWDYFGFKLALDKRKGWYQLSIDEDRCIPSCLQKWPSKAWKDKAGLRHINIYFNNYESWAREHYTGLTEADRSLVKALLSTAPIVRELASKTEAHQEPESREIWDERIRRFIDYSENRSWKLEPEVEVIQTRPSSVTGMIAMMSMGEMGMMSMANETIVLANGIQASPKKWHQSLEEYLELASEPLEIWTLSGHEERGFLKCRMCS